MKRRPAVNILTRIKEGDTDAFKILYDSYHRKIYNYIRAFVKTPFEAEDILQDVFISLWNMRDRIDDQIAIDNLLYKIAKNKSLNVLRKELNKRLYIEYLSIMGSDIDSNTEMKINYEELTTIIHEFIMELPEKRREIFLCSYEKGMSYKEIALNLSITENTVDTQIRKALSYLRENIKKHFNIN